MVARALVEALRFGAVGGGLLGLVVSLWPAGPDGVNALGGGFVPTLVVTLIGALIGILFAYPALIAGSIVADIIRPWVGPLVAFLMTLAGIELVFRYDDLSSPWVALPLGIATYAAVVAWFRIPRILGR